MISLNFPSVTLAISNINKINRLEKAYDNFVAHPSCDAAKYKLEVAFWKCYGKKASAKLINNLAQVHWGQLRAWNVFGYSSPLMMGCNFDSHKTNLSKASNYPICWNLFTFVSGVLLFTLGAFLFFAGLSMLAWLVITVMNTPFSEIENAWVSIFSMTFFIGTLGPAITIFGGWSIRAGIKTFVANEHDFLAKRLHCLLEEQCQG